MVAFFVLVLIGFLIKYWYVVAVGAALYAVACWAAAVSRGYRVAQADRLRHEWARREMDRIALESSRAMVDAALSHEEVINGTATELDRR
jgi:hypothetical protein